MFLSLALILAGCSSVDELISHGDFSRAETKINKMLCDKSVSDLERVQLEDKKRIMDRTRLDFSESQEDVLKVIEKYYPNVDNEQLAQWEEEKSLESMIIDGKKKYFSRSARNLFRIDKEAKQVKIDTDDDNKKSSLTQFVEKDLPMAVKDIKSGKDNLGKAQKMLFTFTLTVDADAVPAGEVVKCWLPFPREGNARQQDVELVSASCDRYVLAPNSTWQRTVYMQKKAVAGTPTVFEIKFKTVTRPQWFDLDHLEIAPYDKSSRTYDLYTAEKYPHVLFTDKLKALSSEIVGSETDPLKIAKKIFEYVNNNYPWAGAREYATIENIPEYVIENHHGDCGQVTLLFMTLARMNGIPARWQSGWMLHPGNINLHDWCQIYFEGIGWVPVDQSFGLTESDDKNVHWFYLGGLDAYRLIVNDDYAMPLFPEKTYLRSETNDFQRGEVEWRGGNLYFNLWDYHMEIEYLK